jgi:hypothetical protein
VATAHIATIPRIITYYSLPFTLYIFESVNE